MESRGAIIATKLRLIDSRLPGARVATRKIAENPYPARPIIAKHYIFVPVLINATVPGFSAGCVTRRRDELTGMKKLESRAAERNVFYELRETRANSSLTDIIKAFVAPLKKADGDKNYVTIIRYWDFCPSDHFRIKHLYYNF